MKLIKEEPDSKREQWNYIFNIFPFIEVPIGILSIVLADNWLVCLCILPLFPFTATAILKISEKRNWQPGYLICTINGALFTVFCYYAGPNAPTWPMVLTVSVGASFMFNNPRVGQVIMITYAALLGLLYYTMGVSWLYAITIFMTLTGFIVVFARTYDYIRLQQGRLKERD